MKKKLTLIAAGAVTACLAAAFTPTGSADFEVLQPKPHGGPVLKAADFGFSPTNTDNAAAINRAIEECRRVKADRLELAPGLYRCHGPKGVVIDGLEDFVLDGKDALLVFWRKHPNDWDAKDGGPIGSGADVTVSNCRRVRVENVKTDRDWAIAPLGFFATCVNKHVDERDNESYVDFEIPDMDRYPLYPNPVPVQLIQPMNNDRTNARMEGGGARCYCGMSPGHFGCKNEWLSPTRLRVWVYVIQPDRPQSKDWGVNGRFSPMRNRGACSAFNVGGMFNVCHYYYGMGGISLQSNEHLTLKNYRLWSCRGHGLGIGGTQKYTLLDGFRLAPPSPEEVKAAGAGGAYLRSFTATADGTHVGRCLGYVKMVNCEWSMHNDDSVNFHDCTTIARTVGPRKLHVVNNFGTGYLAAKVGAEIELRQEDYSITGWTGKIVEMDKRTFTFDRDLPPQAGLFFVLYNRMYSTEHLIFKDCLFHETPWARNLILASNVTFDGCTFKDTLGSPLRFQTCYTYNVWCEGTGCTNVVVRGCTFSNCADFYTVEGVSSQIYAGVRIPGSKGWPEKTTMAIWDQQLKADVDARLAKGPSADVVPACRDVISGILVEKNTFVNPRSLALYAMNGDNIIFRDNKIVFDGKAPYKINPEAGGIRADAATRVQVQASEVVRK